MNAASTQAHIDPVAGHQHRPLYSVMIPTYNCAKYLVETLESVLAQDPGPTEMQIEVVDDVSTKDDPEAVVRKLGKDGRVQFFRQPRNVGPIENFNTCVRRARGHWVHVLHGDDFVLPGFYVAMQRMIEANPHLTLACSRIFFVDEASEIDAITPRNKTLEQPGSDASSFYTWNYLQFAGVVLRRSFLEEHGGFNPSLIHTADWEMWIRCISQGCGMMKNAPLAAYRMFGANHTSQLMRTGENLRDYLRLGSLLAAEHHDFDMRKFRQFVSGMALNQVDRFAAVRDHDAVRANWQVWRATGTWLQGLRYRVRKLLRSWR
jgi:hypothetical protein